MRRINSRLPRCFPTNKIWPLTCHVSCFLLLLLALSSVARAQADETDATVPSPPGSGASPAPEPGGSLKYILHNKHGQPLTGISVQVRNVERPAAAMNAATGNDGSVEFQRLAVGTYEVAVAGGILPPHERVRVDGPGECTILRLPLSKSGIGAGSSVSVQQLAVPLKARAAMNSALEAGRHGEWKKARSHAMRALRVFSGYPAALAFLGFLDMQEGDLEAASNTLKQAIERDPDSGFAYLTLGSTYNSMKQYEAALQALSVFPSVASDTWQLHYEAARAWIGMSKYNAGLEEVQRAQKLVQDDPVILHVARAHALLGLHRIPDATTELRIVVERDQNGPFAAEARSLMEALATVKVDD